LQKKIAFLSIIAAMILCSASILAQELRPETGTVLKESKMDGRGELDIINKGADDAVVVLKASKTGIVEAAVYIRAGDIFNLIGIEDGSYDLYLKQGQNWNAGLQRFITNSSQSRMHDPITFETIKIPEGIRHSVAQITIRERQEGNTVAVPVDDEVFPDLG
jgi:hypothetical protein